MNTTSCDQVPREIQTLRQNLEAQLKNHQDRIDQLQSALASKHPVLEMTNTEAEKFNIWF